MYLLNDSNKMVNLFLIFMLFFNKTVSSTVLNGTFHFCDELNNLKYVNDIDNCRNKTSDHLKSINTRAVVLTELLHQINRVGYQCQFEFGIYRKVSNVHSVQHDVRYQNLSYEQCEQMVTEKSCRENEIKCFEKYFLTKLYAK